MKLRILLTAVAMMVATALCADTNKAPSQLVAQGQNTLYTRMVLVQKAENLKSVKGLDHKKPVKELILDYLKQNAVELKSPSYARFDEKTQALTVYATLVELDKVGTLLVKLREMH
jgi:hypothetical protein